VRLRLAVFASGGGTNLQALLDSFQNRSDSPIRVVLVVSDQAQSGALERARRANIENVVIPVAGRPADFVTRETLAALESADVDLIALAGYLRLIPPVIVKRYRQRMVNIHPALLPAFGGKGMYGARVHQAVIAAGCTISGATVHLVDEHYDQGRIIAQWPVPVLPNDDPDSLADRVLRVEHMLFPAAVEALAHDITNNQEQSRVMQLPADIGFDLVDDHRVTGAAIRHALGLG
jgi:phosphoribosylglycinamide formyltransferase 1